MIRKLLKIKFTGIDILNKLEKYYGGTITFFGKKIF